MVGDNILLMIKILMILFLRSGAGLHLLADYSLHWPSYQDQSFCNVLNKMVGNGWLESRQRFVRKWGK
ncbi:hypothetical protein BGI31_06440 [Snodgrassella communis]|nr:hypothetical protein BGI31_06440 [Snodgrassella communis]